MNSCFSDNHGRSVSYVRLSITDRCNFRCTYCAHSMGLSFIPHNEILRYEEILTLLQGLVEKGITKVRLTGGEPFTRKGFVPFLETLRGQHPGLNICITTNASLLAPHVNTLRDIGINALNISFDTFNANTFEAISGASYYRAVRQGLDAALASGIPVKLNAVALKGVNDNELPDFINFAQKNDIAVRFIEHMPLGGRGDETDSRFWPADEILEAAGRHAQLEYLPPQPGVQPGTATAYQPTQESSAKIYRINGSEATLGIIAPVSGHFCRTCNRLRITPEGSFRTCLFSDDDVPFKHLLRTPGQGLPAVLDLLEKTIARKPLGYLLAASGKEKKSIITRPMSSIGG